MKKAAVEIGQRYRARVSGHLTTIRIDAASPYGGWSATNLSTGRMIRIRSAQRLSPLNPPSKGGAA